jgi:hypothetical protein
VKKGGDGDIHRGNIRNWERDTREGRNTQTLVGEGAGDGVEKEQLLQKWINWRKKLLC